MSEMVSTIQRFREGEEEAFGELVNQWEAKVFNLAFRVVGNREDAQDVVQETFLSVFRSIHGLRQAERFPTWLYRITLNHCRARWRSRRPELSMDDPALSAKGGNGKGRDLPLALLLQQNRRDNIETVDLVRKAMAGLSEEHRTAIVLKEYVGLNLEEVAEVMQCPLSTAKSRLYHGLRGVQRNLKRLL